MSRAPIFLRNSKPLQSLCSQLDPSTPWCAVLPDADVIPVRMSAEPRQHTAAIPLQVDSSDAEADQESKRSVRVMLQSLFSSRATCLAPNTHVNRKFWEIMKGADDKIRRSLSQQRSARWHAVAAEIAGKKMQMAQMRSVCRLLTTTSTTPPSHYSCIHWRLCSV